jgi:hypothetical protein
MRKPFTLTNVLAAVSKLAKTPVENLNVISIMGGRLPDSLKDLDAPLLGDVHIEQSNERSKPGMEDSWFLFPSRKFARQRAETCVAAYAHGNFPSDYDDNDVSNEMVCQALLRMVNLDDLKPWIVSTARALHVPERKIKTMLAGDLKRAFFRLLACYQQDELAPRVLDSDDYENGNHIIMAQCFHGRTKFTARRFSREVVDLFGEFDNFASKYWHGNKVFDTPEGFFGYAWIYDKK